MSITAVVFSHMDADLSLEQEEAVLAAYRNTFTVDDHGEALKAMYALFMKRYGVDAAILRRLIRRDLAENPRLYAKLRHDLASWKIPDSEPVNNKSKHDKANAAKPRTKRGSSLPAPRKAVQNRRTGPGPAGQCRICGQTVRTNRNGTMALHNAQGYKGLVPCPGAGLKVAPPKSDQKRHDDRAEPTSIRTVSSGLGGLGRR